MKITTQQTILLCVIIICATAITCAKISANANRYQPVENIRILDKSTGAVFSPASGKNCEGRVREFGEIIGR